MWLPFLCLYFIGYLELPHKTTLGEHILIYTMDLSHKERRQMIMTKIINTNIKAGIIKKLYRQQLITVAQYKAMMAKLNRK